MHQSGKKKKNIYIYMYILVTIMFKKFISTVYLNFYEPQYLTKDFKFVLVYFIITCYEKFISPMMKLEFNFLIKKVIEMLIVAWVQLSFVHTLNLLASMCTGYYCLKHAIHFQSILTLKVFISKKKKLFFQQLSQKTFIFVSLSLDDLAAEP